MSLEWRRLSAETVSFVTGDVLFSFSSAEGVESWLRLCDAVRGLAQTIFASCGGVPAGAERSKPEFAYAFARASVAVDAGYRLIEACREGLGMIQPSPAIRLAVFSGEVDPQDGLCGESLEKAYALKDLAFSGQFLAPLTTRELARLNIEAPFEFKDLGVHKINEMTPPMRVFQIEGRGVSDSFPQLRSVESPYTNVVPPTTGFIGRERELFEIAMRLRTSKLVTVCGPAGVGKSRVATQLARMLVYEYVDGVFRIDFGELAQRSFILETIVAQLTFIDVTSGDLRSALKRQLGRKQILLIFDNCDALGEPLTKEIDNLRGDLGSAEIIATAREPLGIVRESVYSLPPLDDSSTRADQLDVLQSYNLLTERVNRVLPGFVANEAQERDMLAICERLRGVPLAIELVASRFGSLSAGQVLQQVLSVTEDSRSSRQQDLQVLVDGILNWVYASLPETERLLLRKVSAFSDGWTFEALQFVCAPSFRNDKEIGEARGGLIRKGMITRAPVGQEAMRDGLLPALWQFANQKARLEKEDEANRRLHVQWFGRLAADSAEALIGRNPAQVVSSIERDISNIRSAIEFALGSGQDIDTAYDLIIGYQMFWYRRGLFTEGKVWLQRLLDKAPYERSERRVKVLNILGVFLNASGDARNALATLESGLSEAIFLGLDLLANMIRQNMSISYRGLRDTEKSAQILRDVVERFEHMGEMRRHAVALGGLGGCLIELGELEEALAVTERALELHRDFGNDWLVISSQKNLAEIALRQGQIDKAEPLFTQSLIALHSQKDLQGVAESLRSIADIAARLGQPERAAVLLGASGGVRDGLHKELNEREATTQEALIVRISEALGNATFMRRWTEGANLSPAAAVSYATGSDSPLSLL